MNVKHIVTTADWHLHNGDSYGVYLSSGLNDLLELRLKAARQIIKRTRELDAHLVIAGDFFDEKVIDSITLHHATDVVSKMQKCRFVLLLEGNHGYEGRNNIYSSIGFFKNVVDTERIKIVTKPEIVYAEDIAYFCVPAVSDIERNFKNILKDFSKSIGNYTNVLVLHAGIMRARFDSGVKAKNGIKQELIQKAARKFDYVVCGDFHRHQWLAKNCWYTGSPIQTTLRDKNQKKGFQYIDVNRKKVVFEEIDSIRFIELNWNVGDSICPVLKRPHDFKGVLDKAVAIIRVTYPKNVDMSSLSMTIENLKKSLLDNGAFRVFTDKKTKEEIKKRFVIDNKMGIDEMVEAYVTHERASLPADNTTIVRAGLSFLRG